MANFQIILVKIVVVWTCFLYVVKSDCCLKFLDNKCLQCKQGMHLFRDNCIFNVNNCQTYKDGFQCQKCLTNYDLIDKKCVQKGPTSNLTSNNTHSNSTNNNKITPINFTHLQTITDSQLVDGFTIANQIFKTNYLSQLRNSSITKAEQRLVDKNDTTIQNQIVIEYKNIKNQSYEGIMMINMKTFVFKEISFLRTDIKANTTNGSNQSANSSHNSTNATSVAVLPQVTYQTNFKDFNPDFIFPELLQTESVTHSQIDLGSQQQLQAMVLLDQQAHVYLDSQVKNLPNGKIIKTNKNKKAVDSNTSNNNSNISSALSGVNILLQQMDKSEVKTYLNKQNKSIVNGKYVTLWYKTNDKEVNYIAVGKITAFGKNDKKAINTESLPIELVYAGFDPNAVNRTKINKIMQNNLTNTNTTANSSNTSQANASQLNSTAQANNPQTNTTANNATSNATLQNNQSSTSNSSTSISPSSAQLNLISKTPFIPVASQVQLLNDIHYIIGKDFINQKLKQFSDHAPEKVEKGSLSLAKKQFNLLAINQTNQSNNQTTQQNVIKLLQQNYVYKMLFTLQKSNQNKQTWELIMFVNIKTFDPKIVSNRKLTTSDLTVNNITSATNHTSNSTQTTKNGTNQNSAGSSNSSSSQATTTDNKTTNITHNNQSANATHFPSNNSALSNTTSSNTTSKNENFTNNTANNTTNSSALSTNNTNSTTVNNTNTNSSNATNSSQNNASSTNNSTNSTAINNTNSTKKSGFVVPTIDFVKQQNIATLVNNVYYLISMDNLKNIDSRYSNIKPVEVYINDSSTFAGVGITKKIQFLMKFVMNNNKNNTQEIWAVLVEVSKSNFRGKVVRNQLVEEKSLQNATDKQISEQNTPLKKDQFIGNTDLNTSNMSKLAQKYPGKVILLYNDKQRILQQQPQHTIPTKQPQIEIRKNLRQISEQ